MGQVGEPERSQRSLRPEVGERNFERRRAGDQDHVISYSPAPQRRIRREQRRPGDVPQTPAGAVAVDRGLDTPADGDAHARLRPRAGHREGDKGSAAVETPSRDGRLEVGAAAKPETALDWELRLRAALGQPLAALAAPAAEHARAAAGAHPAQEAVDTAAVTFLGLVGPFDRASIPDHEKPTRDTAAVTSSCAHLP